MRNKGCKIEFTKFNLKIKNNETSLFCVNSLLAQANSFYSYKNKTVIHKKTL